MQTIDSVTIAGGGLRAQVLTLGASVRSLHLDGVAHSLVLGHADPQAYRVNRPYLGSVVGRVANRISGARVTLGGRTHALDANEAGTVTLHGGRDGSSHRFWRITDRGAAHVTLADHLPDGHMGFPGALDLSVTYRLEGGALVVTLDAQAQGDTVCNPAPHLYFALAPRGGAAAHRLTIHADRMIPVERGLPTGGPIPVSGAFDLRAGGVIPPGLDHHFVVADAPGPLRPIAELTGGGLRMTLSSTEPGLQVYDGTGMPAHHGLNGPIGGPENDRPGVALEPHRWIDAPNQPWRDQVLLPAGARFHATSRFAFDRIPG